MRPTSSAVTFVFRIVGAVAFAATAAVLVAACGSRGPLDDDGPTEDAGAADVASADVEVDAEVDATRGPRDDAGREAAATPIDCGICLVGQCGSAILSCVQSPACIKTFQCVITDCVAGGGGGGGGGNGGGGGFDPVCLLKCASGDAAGTLAVLQVFQCVTSKCGADCSSLLGGLLGGGGGGFPGGGGGKGGGGKEYTPAQAQRSFAKAFSHWPELCGPIGD